MFLTLQELVQLAVISFSIEPRHLPIRSQFSPSLGTLSKYELHFTNPIQMYVGQESTIYSAWTFLFDKLLFILEKIQLHYWFS